jgi:hypothetical protein
MENSMEKSLCPEWSGKKVGDVAKYSLVKSEWRADPDIL